MDETTGLVLGGKVLDLKWDSGGWLFHPIVGSFGSSPWRELNRFIVLLILGGRNLWPRMMQESDLCPILPQHSKIIFCLMRKAAITGWIDTVSLFMEDEVPELWEGWPEAVNFSDIQSSLDNYRAHEWFFLCRQQIFCCCQEMWWDLSSWSQWMLWVCWSL